MSSQQLEVQTHPIATRITHWLMALAILILIGSGWRIYNASPIFDFTFPETFTLGGDVEDALALHNDPGVASAIAWHFAAMWLLALSYLGFMLWNICSPAISAATSCRSARCRSGATSTPRRGSSSITGWANTTRSSGWPTGACWLPSR